MEIVGCIFGLVLIGFVVFCAAMALNITKR